MKRRLRGNEKGFSLVELLAAIVIMGLLGRRLAGFSSSCSARTASPRR